MSWTGMVNRPTRGNFQQLFPLQQSSSHVLMVPVPLQHAYFYRSAYCSVTSYILWPHTYVLQSQGEAYDSPEREDDGRFIRCQHSLSLGWHRACDCCALHVVRCSRSSANALLESAFSVAVSTNEQNK